MSNKKNIIYLSVIILLSFNLVSCGKQAVVTTTKVAEVTTTTQTTIATIIEETTTVSETSITLDKTGQLFFEIIKDYDLINKASEYASVNYEIALEALEKGLSNEETGNKYMELAIQIGKDFMVINVIKEKALEDTGIENITDDMKKVIGLINDWSEKTKKYYEYTAKYYYGEGAEYEIKADELEGEINDISDEYIKLREQILLK